MILNDAEIEAKLQEHINREWPPAMREKTIRLGGQLLIDLNAFFDQCALLKADMVAKRDADQLALDTPPTIQGETNAAQ